jgi:hypothetical protein
MTDRDQQAKVTALWIMHGAACVKILRARGRRTHADNFEAALSELTEIVAGELGRAQLVAALDWAANQVGQNGVEFDPVPTRH